MQAEEITNPSQHVKDVTSQMVSRLKQLDPEEEIDIVHVEKAPNVRSRFVRKLTGEVLAEINEPFKE